VTAHQHEWARIVCDGEPIDVSADAVRVGGVRVALSWTEADALARELGGELPAPRILDARWRAARWKTLPCPGPVTTKTAEEHSAEVDRQLAARGYDGTGIVGNVGKHWCAATAPTEAPLYGWHIDGPPTAWRGIPLHGCFSGFPGVSVIQPYARAAHNREHRDYSMTGVFCRRVVQPAPDWSEGIDLASATLGERCCAWLGWMSEQGLKRIPGPAHDQRILALSAHCRRGGRFLGVEAGQTPLWAGGLPVPLDEDEDPWCAATQSEALRLCLRPGESPPHGLRISVRELWQDALATRSTWGPAYSPRPGDLAILGRAGEHPTRGGRGHVRRLVQVLGDGKYLGIGGNEGGTITRAEHRLDDPALEGWIAYPRG
jgi:hypothetical protein